MINQIENEHFELTHLKFKFEREFNLLSLNFICISIFGIDNRCYTRKLTRTIILEMKFEIIGKTKTTVKRMFNGPTCFIIQYKQNAIM